MLLLCLFIASVRARPFDKCVHCVAAQMLVLCDQKGITPVFEKHGSVTRASIQKALMLTKGVSTRSLAKRRKSRPPENPKPLVAQRCLEVTDGKVFQRVSLAYNQLNTENQMEWANVNGQETTELALVGPGNQIVAHWLPAVVASEREIATPIGRGTYGIPHTECLLPDEAVRVRFRGPTVSIQSLCTGHVFVSKSDATYDLEHVPRHEHRILTASRLSFVLRANEKRSYEFVVFIYGEVAGLGPASAPQAGKQLEVAYNEEPLIRRSTSVSTAYTTD